MNGAVILPSYGGRPIRPNRPGWGRPNRPGYNGGFVFPFILGAATSGLFNPYYYRPYPYPYYPYPYY